MLPDSECAEHELPVDTQSKFEANVPRHMAYGNTSSILCLTASNHCSSRRRATLPGPQVVKHSCATANSRSCKRDQKWSSEA